MLRNFTLIEKKSKIQTVTAFLGMECNLHFDKYRHCIPAICGISFQFWELLVLSNLIIVLHRMFKTHIYIVF